MKDIITEQHIRRRRQPSPLSRAKASYKTFYNDTARQGAFGCLPEQIKQKPAHKVHKKHKKTNSLPRRPVFSFPVFSFSSLFRSIGSFQRPRKNEEEAAAREKTPQARPKKTGTAGFSLSPFPLVFLGALLFFSVLAVIRPEEFLKGVLRETYSLEPREDGALRQNLASYAGFSPAALTVTDEPIPLDLMETFTWKSYTVGKGDSVSKIAADHAISMDAIIASNNIANARRLREGEVLRIPNMDGIPYTVKNGDTLSKISAGMEVPLEAILDANDIGSENISSGTVLFIPGARMRTEDLKLALGELFIYPIRGRLTSPFGWRNDPINGERRYHAALDLAAPTGTPIKAAMDGRVSTVGFNSVYGQYIIISHSGAYQTMYAHLSLASVRQGTYIYQGTKIGEVGSTGYSTGPHLHFAVYKNGRAVNPLELLSP
jgi:murein DD-endopeptidase MepM/ murein hydrolase activator NlpD